MVDMGADTKHFASPLFATSSDNMAVVLLLDVLLFCFRQPFANDSRWEILSHADSQVVNVLRLFDLPGFVLLLLRRRHHVFARVLHTSLCGGLGKPQNHHKATKPQNHKCLGKPQTKACAHTAHTARGGKLEQKWQSNACPLIISHVLRPVQNIKRKAFSSATKNVQNASQHAIQTHAMTLKLQCDHQKNLAGHILKKQV